MPASDSVTRLTAVVDERAARLDRLTRDLAERALLADAASATLDAARAEGIADAVRVVCRDGLRAVRRAEEALAAVGRAEAALLRACRALGRACAEGQSLPPHPDGRPRTPDDVRAVVALLERHAGGRG